MADEPEIPATDDDLYPAAPVVNDPLESLLGFRLGDEWYAVPLTHVREVLRVTTITPLPAVPPPILGVVNVRGTIMSVTDPKSLLALPSTALTPASRFIVLATASAETVLLVDEVETVFAMPQSRLEPVLATLDAKRGAWVTSTCRWRDRLVAVLRGDRLLASREDAAVSDR